MTDDSMTDSARRLETVRLMALDVWGNETDASRFMAQSHPLLDNQTPEEVAGRSDDGCKLVADILGRLKYGSPA